MHDKRFEEIVKDIHQIVNTQIGKTKTETLARQRGYLTGWLARIARQNPEIAREINIKIKHLEK